MMALEPITREEKFLAKAGGQNVETPTPITRKEMFLQEVAKKGGAGGVTSWNDLTDKPFYEEENALLLPETQFVGGLMDGALVALGASVELVEGNTYTVNWNGVDYETVCFMGVSPIDGTNMLGLGNPAAVGGANNNQPFVLSGNERALAAIPLDGSTSAIVSISGYGVEPIPEKYLVNAFPLCVRITGSGTDSNPYVCDTTVAKLDEAYHNDRMIILKSGEENGDLSNHVMYYLAGRHRLDSTGDYQYGAVYTFSALTSGLASYILVPRADGTYEVTI